MATDKTLFVFDAPGTAMVSFDTVRPADTTVLVIGLIIVVFAAWLGRRDKRIWLAPLALTVFVAVIETENYLDSAGRFDRLMVSETGVALDSDRDESVKRFIAFNQIRQVAPSRSGRFEKTCRVNIELLSGKRISSVNFYDPAGRQCSRIHDAIARLETAIQS